MLVQALNGALGVLYALLRNMQDGAVLHNCTEYFDTGCSDSALVVGQIAVCAIIRLLTELSMASFENIFKKRLLRNIALEICDRVIEYN